jgi:hypothetical protein
MDSAQWFGGMIFASGDSTACKQARKDVRRLGFDPD